MGSKRPGGLDCWGRLFGQTSGGMASVHYLIDRAVAGKSSLSKVGRPGVWRAQAQYGVAVPRVPLSDLCCDRSASVPRAEVDEDEDEDVAE